MSSRKAASIWTARFIPALLVLIVAYVSYVIVGPLSINYLINPPPDRNIPPRLTLGIVLPVVYLLLLIPVAICWLRLLLVVLLDPGYIPQGPEDATFDSRHGLEDFWMRDAFVCDPNGLPIWCDHCRSYKPDRTHHSQDAGRCTRKMDHFCPWIGGVVGERSLKFFIQFLSYSMVLTCYVTVVLAYFVHEYHKDVQMIVGLALAGFFLLFTLGMVINSLHLAFLNTTTIENVSRRMHIAVVLPPELQRDPLAPPPPAKVSPAISDLESERPMTSDIDDPSHLSYFTRQQSPSARRAFPSNASPPPKSKIWKSTITYPLHLPTDRPPIPAPVSRTFAVLQTPPGLNLWNLGSPYKNFTAIFGTNPYEWLLPIKHSPCCDHSSAISEFPLGPEFELLLVDCGLVRPEISGDYRRSSSSAPSRRRKRRLDPGWQNGERPDGWISEKEARRIRHEWKRRAENGRHTAVQ